MKTDSIIEELEEKIDDDAFDDLEEKLETLLMLSAFRKASDMRECSLCLVGRMLDECTGDDVGRCEHCKGIGYIPIA